MGKSSVYDIIAEFESKAVVMQCLGFLEELRSMKFADCCFP
jgi:hypothetical protein